MANKAVAKAGNTEVAVLDISMFEEDAGRGMENMGQDDLALPFLKVLSGNDPVLDENEEARKGDIYTPSPVRFTKVRTAFALCLALTSAGSSSGLLAAAAPGHPWQFTSPATLCRRR